MNWIKDNRGCVLINLNHIRSIEIEEGSEVVMAVYGQMTDRDKENPEEDPLYERFILYEGYKEGDAAEYLHSLSKKLKAMD